MTTTTTNEQATKLRKFADKLLAKSRDKLASRRENTPKQQQQAGEARYQGHNYKIAGEAALALAEGHARGTLPAALHKYQSMSAIEGATMCKAVRGTGYYSVPSPDYDNYYDNSADAVALREFCFGRTDPEESAKHKDKMALDQMLSEVRQSRIDGFFPTPDEIIEDYLLRGVDVHGKVILESSAGIGSIADKVREHGGSTVCVEVQYTLCKILELKGHTVIRGDFMDLKPHAYFDHCLINPPFEKDHGLDHVRRSYEFIQPHGILRAILPSGIDRYGESRNRKRREFFEWFMSLESMVDFLPEGAFKSAFRSTSVNTCMLTIIKE